MYTIIKLIVSLLIALLTPTLSHGQVVEQNKTVLCMPIGALIQGIGPQSEFKETLVWMGLDDQSKSRYFVSHNIQSKTWTIFEIIDQQACVYASGVGSRLNIIDGKQVRLD